MATAGKKGRRDHVVIATHVSPGRLMATAGKKGRQAAVPPGLTFEEGNRRGDIVRAAGRLFREKGYAATTIRDIAGAVGMRSGSPFYHFKTKHEILRAVVTEGMHAIHAAVEAEARKERPPRARFEAMLRAHLRQLLGEEGKDFAAALLHESRHLEAPELAEIVALKDRYEAMWQALLKELKKEGALADDSRVARLFLMGAMNWTVQWYRPEGPKGIDALARQLAAFVLR